MVTIPKIWRDELGLETGEVVKAKKVGNKVIIEAQEPAPYRIFSDNEIKEWLKEDINKYFKPLKIVTPGELLEILVS